jgi:hypothetical protein
MEKAEKHSFKKRMIVLGIVLSGLFVNARAGTPPPDFSASHVVSLQINESTGYSWVLDLTGMLSYQSATGAWVMPTTGTTISPDWDWTKIDVRNQTTGLFEQKDALRWHTAERSEDDSAWRSTVTFYGAANVDPFMTYGLTARNATNAVQTYTFSYGESIVPPLTGAYQLYSDIAGSITNAVSGTTARISPVVADLDGDLLPEVQTLNLSTDGGVTFVNAGVDVGPDFETTTVSGSTSYGVYSSQKTGMLGTAVDYWRFDTEFTLTPGRDAVALSGFAEIAAIPEVSTSSLFLGLLALAAAGYRKVSRGSPSVKNRAANVVDGTSDLST